MASLKTRDNSPYYYMQFKDPPGKWKTKKTNYLVGVPPYDKEARAHCAYQSAHEKAAKGVTPTQKWDEWVSPFFRTHCINEVTREGSDRQPVSHPVRSQRFPNQPGRAAQPENSPRRIYGPSCAMARTDTDRPGYRSGIARKRAQPPECRQGRRSQRRGIALGHQAPL